MISVFGNVEENIKKIIKKDSEMILTFTGPGCVPCKMMKERFKETNDLHGVPIYMVSMEDAPNLANEYLVMGVPTTVHLREGSEVSRAVGMRNQEQLAIEFNLR